MGKARNLSKLSSALDVDGAVPVAKGGTGNTSGAGVVTPSAISDQESTSTGYFDLPGGTTAQRPVTPQTGNIRYNTTTGFAEVYTSAGWGIFGSLPPTISSVSPTSFSGTAGTAFTINGSGFNSDAVVKFITSTGTETNAASVVFLNSTTLTATTIRNFTTAEEPLSVKVTQASGQNTLSASIDCGSTPVFTNPVGSLGNVYDGSRSTYSLLPAVATDNDSGTTLVYSITAGSLPVGLSMNSSTGAFSGTASAVVSDTTYSFTVQATDGINTNTRDYSITVKAPITVVYQTAGTITWTAPVGATKLNSIIMIGAGGGGSSGNGAWAAGGGGGGCVKATQITIVPQTNYTLVVGAKGLGATSCGGVGSSGGNTTAFGNIAYGGLYAGPQTAAGQFGSYLLTAGTNNGSANGTSGDASTGDGSGGGGNNGGGSTYGLGATGVSNYTPGNHATGNGNGGGGGHSCQQGHRGGGDGSVGYISITY